MNTNKELDYRLYLQRDEEFVRTDVRKEFSRYEAIVSGDVAQVKKNFEEVRKDFFAGKGVLSQNPLRNSIYHLVVSMAVIARMCVEAGLPHSEAYTISDIYIQSADVSKSVDEVIDLIGKAQVDFAERMRKLRKTACEGRGTEPRILLQAVCEGGRDDREGIYPLREDPDCREYAGESGLFYLGHFLLSGLLLPECLYDGFQTADGLHAGSLPEPSGLHTDALISCRLTSAHGGVTISINCYIDFDESSQI